MAKRKKKKNKNSFGKFISYSIVTMFAMFLAGLTALKVYTLTLEPIKNLEEYKPNIVTQIYSADGEIIKTFTAYTSTRATIDEIPEYLKQAIVATEDKNFYSHEGYDLTGLARSTIANIKAGRVVQGASTITQQLARLLFLNNEKTYDRKIKEFILSTRIEKSIPKDKILEMYLNNVYLGSGAYGVAGAAKIYFNKELKDLTLSECALIAGLPQAPSVYSPFNNLNKAIKRRNQVLGRMYKMRYISKPEYNEAKNSNVTLNPYPSIYAFNKAPYFVDYVMQELSDMGFDEKDISTGGYKIYTTLNAKAQKSTNEAIIKNLNSWGLKNDKTQAAVFSFSPMTGEILVYAAGKDYSKTQYDRITQAVRPPGSAFKPFVYATAIEKGWGPNDLLEDTPIIFNKWSPRNYGSKYRGRIPLYAGLMISSNVMAVRLIEDVGIRPVIAMARSLGITTPLEQDMTIALGSNGVKLYDMTIAYGAFANGGYKVKPFSVKKVETNRGKIVYNAPKARATKAISYETAATMTAMMKTVVQYGTGRSANFGVPSAAKTGTTDDYRDAWFVGYTPDVVTGVWVGNDDNSVMPGLTGGTIPALIWKDIMKIATAEFKGREFDYPEVEIKMVKMPQSRTIEEINSEIEKTKKTEENKLEENTIIDTMPKANIKNPEIDIIQEPPKQSFSDIFNANKEQIKSNEEISAPIPLQNRYQ